MGLQKLFEGLYGPTPYIDLDLQIARARIPKVGTLDFHALHDGVIRNNVGVDSMVLTVSARIEERTVILAPSGQRLPLDGDAPPDAATAQLRDFEVRGFAPGEQVKLAPRAPRR